MNLAELMKKHPGKKYRQKEHHPNFYITYNGYGDWINQCGDVLNPEIAAIFMEDDWELYQESINITRDDIFRTVKLADGTVGEIVGIYNKGIFVVIIETDDHYIRTTVSGKTYDQDAPNVVEIL